MQNAECRRQKAESGRTPFILKSAKKALQVKDPCNAIFCYIT